jgi:hypothetical protein
MQIVLGTALPHKLQCRKQTLVELKVTGHKTTLLILNVG